MSRKILFPVLFFLAGFTFCSCDDSETIKEPTVNFIGDFLPTEITFVKSNNNIDVNEKWSQIVRDSENRIISYKYTLEINDDIREEKKENECRLHYYTDLNGKEAIRATTNITFYKKTYSNGIEESYSETTDENISTNNSGLVESIKAITYHYGSGTTEPTIKDSEQKFTYDGNFCTGSKYIEKDISISYKYTWDAYRLKSVTILKEDSKNKFVDYKTYEYTYDATELYEYSGTQLLAFIQGGCQQILASMGYLGKSTPYILLEETQNGYTKYGNTSSPDTPITNTFELIGDANQRFTYSAVSDIYDETYSITFTK